MKTLIKTCGCGLTFREEKEGTGKCPACVARASATKSGDVVRAAGNSEGAKKGWEHRLAGNFKPRYESDAPYDQVRDSIENSHAKAMLGKHAAFYHMALNKLKQPHTPDQESTDPVDVLGGKAGNDHFRLAKEAEGHAAQMHYWAGIASKESSAKASEQVAAEVIHCRAHASAAGEKLGASEPWKCGERVEFMFMPAGTHTINAGFRNGSIELTVKCDEQTAGAVQASLDQWRQERPKQEPFGCVEHREHEASVRVSASGGFSWKEDGVYLAAEPTTLGAENVNGKVHRSWSPSFTTDADYDKAKEVRGSGGQVTLVFPEGVRGSRSNPAAITGVDFCVGTLTNKPAFHAMSPVKSSETVTAAGTSEGARKGWLSRQGEFTSIAKSKGHVAFFKDPHGMAHELYKDSSGNLYRAPHDNVMDVTTKNRIGRWEAPPHTADRAAKMLLEDVWATDQEFEDSIHAHCSHLLLNDVPDATPEELSAYDRVVDGGGSHQQAVEECRTKRKHAEAATAVESVTLEAIYAERKRATETANSIRAETHGKPLTVEEVYRQTHDVAFKKVEVDKGKSIYARAGGNG